MSQKPIPTKDQVKEVFFKLLEENDKTTSLEVKEKLRENGFWATQQIIGPMLHEISEEENKPWDFDGNHRIYYNEVPSNWINPPNCGSPSINQSQPIKKPKIQLDPKDKEPLSTAEDGCWSCFSELPTGLTTSEYFSSKLTRGQAKSAFKNLYPLVDYVNIRCNRYIA